MRALGSAPPGCLLVLHIVNFEHIHPQPNPTTNPTPPLPTPFRCAARCPPTAPSSPAWCATPTAAPPACWCSTAGPWTPSCASRRTRQPTSSECAGCGGGWRWGKGRATGAATSQEEHLLGSRSRPCSPCSATVSLREWCGVDPCSPHLPPALRPTHAYPARLAFSADCNELWALTSGRRLDRYELKDGQLVQQVGEGGGR